MLAGTIEWFIFALNIQNCCCCLDLKRGIQLLGLLQIGLNATVMSAVLIWSCELKTFCYSPISIPENETCVENLQANATQFQAELIAISNFFKDFKPKFDVFLATFVLALSATILSAVLMIFGVIWSKKLLLIPWLICTKLWIICFLLVSLLIIFLEGRLYKVGRTVFGLVSIVTLSVSALLFYLLTVVQSFYIKLEQTELCGCQAEVPSQVIQNGGRPGHTPSSQYSNAGFETDPSYEIIIKDNSIYPDDVFQLNEFSRGKDRLTVEPIITEISRL